jgi:hypothetical protein
MFAGWGAVEGATGVVVSGDEAGAAVSCAVALNATSREAAIIHLQVRMTQILSIFLSTPV